MDPLPKRTVTCISIGMYGDALTRGRKYETLAEDEEKRQIHIRGDNGRHRWFPASHFDREGGHVPVMVRGQFDEPIEDEVGGWVEVSFTLDDGSERWCILATPLSLTDYLKRNSDDPGLWCPHIMVVRKLTVQEVGRMLHHLDQQGELIQASLPLHPDLGKSEDPTL